MSVHACTIVSRSHLPGARVLAESFRAHHPDGSFDVVVLDGDRYPVSSAEPFGVVEVADLGIEPLELRRMVTAYNVFELATALKPWLLRTLLERHDHAVYLDSDIAVYAPLERVADLARAHSLVLTPHVTVPLDRAIAEPVETTVLRAGQHNLGFVAASRDAADVLAWWVDRLRRESLDDPEHMRFVDQRWMDLVPGFRERMHALRDPEFNVAWWNLLTRRVGWDGERYTVDGRPLAFFHFTGYDPDRPHLLSRHQGEHPRVLLSEEPALRRLCDDYGARLLAAGLSESAEIPYGWDTLTSGVPVTPDMRRLYREALRDAEGGISEEPPVPFDPATEDAFLAWLAESDEPGAEPRVSRYLRGVWARRPDLRRRYPDLRWADSRSYLRWVATEGRYEEAIPHELVPEPAALRNGAGGAKDAVAPRPGLALFAGPDGEERASGLAEAAGHAGIACALDHVDSAAFETTVVCVRADAFADLRHDVGPDPFTGRAVVLACDWDLPLPPAGLPAGLVDVDELWVPGNSVREALEPAVDVPVAVVPPVVRASDERPSRADLGLPDAFLVLVVADLADDLERQNPLAAVRAYARAFAPDGGARLHVHGVGADEHVREAELLRLATDRPDMTFAGGPLPPEARRRLAASADCLLSLHRSVGFAQVPAEAVAAETPLVATAFGGVLDLLAPESAWLVPWEPAPVPARSGGDGDATWAEPDVEAAAAALRAVFHDPEAAAARAERARAELARTHSVAAAATALRARVDDLAARRPAGSAR